VQHDQREISAITVTCSPEIRQQMKEKIVALRKELLALSAQSKESTEVVQVNFQLFPVAQMTKGSKT